MTPKATPFATPCPRGSASPFLPGRGLPDQPQQVLHAQVAEGQLSIDHVRALNHTLELRPVVGDPTTRSAEGERRADDRGETGRLDGGQSLIERPNQLTAGHRQADAGHRFREGLPVFRHPDRPSTRTDQFHPIAFQRPIVVQGDGNVQRGLATHRGQQRVGTLTFDYLRDPCGGDRLDVRAVGQFRIGHDRRGVRVDQDHPVTFLAQRLDGLRGKMYWTDIGSSKIQRANLDGSELENLLTSPVVFTPVGIALDLAECHIYWTESTLADFMILRADLDGSNVELLVTDLVSPSGIALDIPSVSCPADLDQDGDVGPTDLALLLGDWGACDGCPADFNNDGSVGAADLAQLLGSWGPCS